MTELQRWLCALCALAIVTLSIAWAITVIHEQDCEREKHMATHGYEQSGIPGATGIYWVKSK